LASLLESCEHSPTRRFQFHKTAPQPLPCGYAEYAPYAPLRSLTGTAFKQPHQPLLPIFQIANEQSARQPSLPELPRSNGSIRYCIDAPDPDFIPSTFHIFPGVGVRPQGV
jgi:hypothetical protein